MWAGVSHAHASARARSLQSTRSPTEGLTLGEIPYSGARANYAPWLMPYVKVFDANLACTNGRFNDAVFVLNACARACTMCALAVCVCFQHSAAC